MFSYIFRTLHLAAIIKSKQFYLMLVSKTLLNAVNIIARHWAYRVVIIVFLISDIFESESRT